MRHCETLLGLLCIRGFCSVSRADGCPPTIYWRLPRGCLGARPLLTFGASCLLAVARQFPDRGCILCPSALRLLPPASVFVACPFLNKCLFGCFYCEKIIKKARPRGAATGPPRSTILKVITTIHDHTRLKSSTNIEASEQENTLSRSTPALSQPGTAQRRKRPLV